ncbi:HET-domain-containing protein [Stipitochalara longipes BDJ]|nr:HET-domain-containing protein [Stipitochalara longipes BDJ]
MEESLCGTCRALNFEQLFRERRDPHTIYWRVSELTVWSKYCPFCKLLFSIVNSKEIKIPHPRDHDWTIEAKQVLCARYNPPSGLDTLANTIAIQARSITSQLGAVIGFPLRPHAPVDLSYPYSNSDEMIYKLRIQISKDGRLIYPDEQSDLPPKIPCIQLLASGDGTKAEQKIMNFRAIDPDRVDFRSIKRWLHKCERSHSGCRVSPERTGLSIFRLIDVERECLVNGSPGWRYLALSYVWGSAPRLTLNLQNQEALYEPGSLSTLNDDIPRTIRDSFFLCKQLKERYIWVDSLCIIQNSPIDKYAQIAHMDQIYHGALLTVVGAAGDARTGLPGIADTMRKTTQLVASFHDMKFSAAPDTTNDLLANSPWSFRGWTLQEQILSRRLLVFTDQMAFLNCREAIFREDIQAKAAMGDIVIVDPIEKSIVRSHGSLVDLTPSSNQPRPKEILSALQEYAELVYDYTNRSLTNEEDILNAFTGVLKTFIPTLGAFRFGMPLNFLGITLLWELQGKSIAERRKGIDIPSWSWAAWAAKKIEIHFPIIYSPIHMFEFRDTDQVSKITTNLIPTRIAPEVDLDENIEEQCRSFQQDELQQIKLYKLTSPLYQYLLFWTSVAMLHVRFPLVPFEPTKDEAHSYEICGNDGEFVGRVFLADSWRKSQPERLEFALVGVRELGHVFLMVLVLERKDGIARRVQSTFLKQKDWIDANPERKLILLA